MTPPLMDSAILPSKFTPAEASAPLAVRGLTVAYHGKPVLWDVDYVQPQGALAAIVGPNGAGKTTFIKAVLGLVPKLAGSVHVYGASIDRNRRRIGYVPQRSSVDWDFPASAEDVVAMGLYGQIGWLRPVRAKHRRMARDYLDRVGMADYADRQIGQLSGGQQQRVFLARALAEDADLYLMDEPFAGVDAASERAIVEVLHALQASGKTAIVVHHDLQTVSEYFDHVLVMNLRRIAAGPLETAFTEEALQKAYGGRLAPSELAAIATATA